jgi:hypothetical protein
MQAAEGVLQDACKNPESWSLNLTQDATGRTVNKSWMQNSELDDRKY